MNVLPTQGLTAITNPHHTKYCSVVIDCYFVLVANTEVLVLIPGTGRYIVAQITT